ncbi:MAG: GDP-mannose 4,6 dehydratase, partial [Bryobacterales bacterium]|nr:GDP-mannose 4,6 dehydratase [Bryobacterales bacterium]
MNEEVSTLLERTRALVYDDFARTTHKLRNTPMEKTNGIGRHILITGGAGFIGSHVASELLRNGYRVRV